MRVAILMETSGIIREAFRKKGHDVVSVDFLPSDDNSPHHKQMDVWTFITDCQDLKVMFDLIIAHPTCTALSVSGNHVYAKGKPKHSDRLKAISLTEDLFTVCRQISGKVCFENPVGVLATMSILPKPQYIQPYCFGEDASKKTGLFLHNLPPLINTMLFPGRSVNGKLRWSNQTDSGQNKLPPSKDRWKLRSKTYPGIADAMADQWG